MSTPRGGRHWPRCECGRKRIGAAGCALCLALDGHPRGFGFLQVLRSLGGAATTEALMVEARMSRETVAANVARMVRRGRLRSVRIPSYSEAHDGLRGSSETAMYILLDPVTL